MIIKKEDTVSIPASDESTVSPGNHSEIDLSLIEYNLSLSFERRLEEHQSALNLALELQRAGEELRSMQNEAGP
jgi:hypothetical protein